MSTARKLRSLKARRLDVNNALHEFGSIVVSQFTQYSRVWNGNFDASAA
jgi:hypothetical protein